MVSEVRVPNKILISFYKKYKDRLNGNVDLSLQFGEWVYWDENDRITLFRSATEEELRLFRFCYKNQSISL